jgi:hypothetical protein
MTYANKYEEEAHLLAQGLQGTKWVEALEPRSVRISRSSFGTYTREQPMAALAYAAGAAFLLGALWTVLRR